MSADFTLSVLDNAFTGHGITAQESLAEVVALARTAEERGYQRFWMSEHHGMPGAATSSPQMMLARLTGETSTIRLGAGGVMLPNHAPLLVAEQFGMLDALAPGRIDLGLGRAPGTDHATAMALRRHHEANDHFPQQVEELVGFLGDDFPAGHPYAAVHAVPGPWQAAENGVAPAAGPELWILGSSPHSAQLAAQLGRPYAFALQFGGADVLGAMKIYRDNFQPSRHLAEPHTLLSVSTVAHDDPQEARRQARSGAMAMLRMFQRKPFSLLTPDQVDAYRASPQEQEVIASYTANTLHGTGAQVGEGIERLNEQVQADEVMLVVTGHSRQVLRRTLELVADHFGM
ncbi:MAG: LLM class flavin-dependent oxidoreductase [Luteococcus sp.]|uniref:LLM class flavin-dependent oxidoreductase n=1 Tax=Luteococcus sp. TaxID=1969402 RepID=UPI002647874E|nr:LLM class flavin-dependent oxidoreductase [Luteococcus sp.]MDN5563723.1 LLM class flavin-dependent oxidoreductase [Luteococcus sp.]